MGKKHKNKWVVVTGASTGIGRASAELLASHGFNVYAGVRKESDLQEFKQMDRVQPLKLDVTKPDEVQAAFQYIHDKGTGLYGLVNNAGIARGGPLMDLPDKDLVAQFEVNLMGVHRVSRAMFPLLLASKGRIIMISSDSGFFATPFFGPYCASKFALEGYSDALRRELLPFGVKVVIIQPGRVTTPIWNKGEALLAEARQTFEGSIFADMALKIGEYAISKGKTSGLPPRDIAKMIHKTLTVKNPKLRYLIAPSTLKYRMIKVLPGRMVDKMIEKEMGEL